jgi:hypothetical protein
MLSIGQVGRARPRSSCAVQQNYVTGESLRGQEMLLSQARDFRVSCEVSLEMVSTTRLVRQVARYIPVWLSY